MRRSWRTEVTVSLPRLEPAVGFEAPPHVMGDAEFTLVLCSLRLALPDAGVVLSTRESPALRDGLIPLGVTHMSAGSRTEPGGYSHPDEATEQFSITDHRAPAEVARALRDAGYDPVWKDSSAALRRGAPVDRL
jgi:2-iminoacetate synthase